MVISRTPFRMSFFGGGTDFKDYYEKNGGAVISAAFDKYCFVTVRDYPPYFPNKNQLTYSKIERFDSLDELSHPLVRETLKYLGEKNIQITYDADLPARSGIGSSSSFAVGLLNSLHTLRGRETCAFSLANEAIMLERERCAEYGGIQDQIAAAYGGFNRIDFDASGFHVKPVGISASRLCELSSKLMLFFSGLSRISGEIAREQNDNIPVNTRALGEMKTLTDDAEKLLVSGGSLDEFGYLLDYGWRLKQSLAGNISNEDIQRIYEKARSAGALGGKLLGAGGGGFMLFFVPEEKQAAVRDALEKYMFVPFRFEKNGSEIIYDYK